MTPEQQQIAIAKACGWKIANPENDRADYRHWTPPNCVAKPNHIYGDRPPDYLNDLNACHEMEKVLNLNQFWAYAKWLIVMVDPLRGQDSYISSTAAQRAEAFLRTLGLWHESNTQPQ